VPAARRRAKPRGPLAIVYNYPWATTIFVALIVIGAFVFARGQHLGPFAEAKAQPPSCNLTTHICQKPAMTINKNKSYTATLKTTKGDIVIQLDAKNAPLAVNNFVYLANQHYYNGTYFWRIEKPGQPSPLDGQPSTLSLIQGGTVSANPQKDPKENQRPGYTFNDDPITGNYVAGTVAMANQNSPNTNGAQFFICTGDDSKVLAKKYDIFGTVTQGLDVAQKMTATDKILSVTITVK
jgi:cyclophilin family peptidyl-prolyl cis-trans isomerase